MMNWLLRVVAALLIGIGIAGYVSVLWQRVPPFRTEFAIAFESNRSSFTNDIFLYENGRIRQLIETDEHEGHLSWSPDGSQLLYEGYRDPADLSASSFDARSNLDIWLYDIQLQAALALTNHPANDFQPAWSPDGTYIAFISVRDAPATGGADLYVLHVNTGTITRITPKSSIIAQFAWSPDSHSLAFAGRPTPVRTNPPFNIYLADVTTPGNPQVRVLLQHPDSSDLLPRFSPDGQYLTFLSDINSNQNITLVNIETSQQFNLLPAGYRMQENAAWSPAGKLVAVSAYGGSSSTSSDIHIIDVTTLSGGSGTITDTITNPRNDRSPAWSPDGKHIAFVHDQRQTGRFAYAGNCEIMVYDIATRVQHRLAKAAEGTCDNNPVWRPISG
ncbi:MAG: hypothetical protein AAFV33_11175 [Chloroflexota bacterium]